MLGLYPSLHPAVVHATPTATKKKVPRNSANSIFHILRLFVMSLTPIIRFTPREKLEERKNQKISKNRQPQHTKLKKLTNWNFVSRLSNGLCEQHLTVTRLYTLITWKCSSKQCQILYIFLKLMGKACDGNGNDGCHFLASRRSKYTNNVPNQTNLILFMLMAWLLYTIMRLLQFFFLFCFSNALLLLLKHSVALVLFCCSSLSQDRQSQIKYWD